METNQMQYNSQEEWIEAYEKPAIEVIEMEMEGILCGSPNANAIDYENGGGLDKW